MKFLITGGAGFLGSHVAKQLLDEGHKVVIIDDLSGGFKRNVPEGAELYPISIVDTKYVDAIFAEEQFDYVYHLAAYAAEGLSHFIRHYNYTNNVIGSINLINAAIKYKVKAFIFTSSMAVYGTQQVPYDESLKPAPEDPYGIAKYSIEQDLATAHEMFGLNYIIFRPHNIYGVNQHIGDRYRNVIGIFMNKAMQDKDITVFGDGEQTRAFSYVGDMVPIMAKAYNRKAMYQQIFNIGGDTPCTIGDIAEIVLKVMNTKSKIVHLPERFEVKHAFSDHDNIRKHFILNQTPLSEGITEMATWAESIGPQNSPDMKLELTDNLYEAWR